MMPETLHRRFEQLFRTSIHSTVPIPGGDIHRALRVEANDGRVWFIKYNAAGAAAEMFRTEAQGLALLGAGRVIRTPKVWAYGTVEESGISYLVLEFILSGYRNRLFWERFGAGLAALHGNTAVQYGFGHDNFIASLPQSNRRHDTWSSFYAHERLLPQGRLAREADRLSAAELQLLERLCGKLDHLCPAEGPALIHGDLWQGNFLCDPDGMPVLIDPSAAFAHREMDLASAHLFGGFDTAFFTSYESWWSLEPGFEDRMEVYQLYYLLVHLNLFGQGNVEQVRRILKRYGL